MNSMNMSNPASMSNSTTSGGMSMMMVPWLHFGNGDAILFSSWTPSTQGAVAGACIGLIVLAILERCISTLRRVQEVRWTRGSNLKSSSMQSIIAKEAGGEEAAGAHSPHTRLIPPFVLSHDVQRGIIQVMQSTVGYALMLVVMTFNGAYVISIILGLGIGELLVGRIARQHIA